MLVRCFDAVAGLTRRRAAQGAFVDGPFAQQALRPARRAVRRRGKSVPRCFQLASRRCSRVSSRSNVSRNWPSSGQKCVAQLAAPNQCTSCFAFRGLRSRGRRWRSHRCERARCSGSSAAAIHLARHWISRPSRPDARRLRWTATDRRISRAVCPGSRPSGSWRFRLATACSSAAANGRCDPVPRRNKRTRSVAGAPAWLARCARTRGRRIVCTFERLAWQLLRRNATPSLDAMPPCR